MLYPKTVRPHRLELQHTMDLIMRDINIERACILIKVPFTHLPQGRQKTPSIYQGDS